MRTPLHQLARCLTIFVCLAPAAFGATTVRTLGTYTYDGSGNVKSIGPDRADLTNYYQYDTAGRLVRFERKNASGTVVLTETFEYDSYGNQTKQTTNGAVTSLTAAASTNRLTAASYDADGNMTVYGGESYKPDPVGTMTSKTGSWGTALYIYTADDERIGIKGPDGTWRYTVRDLDDKVIREWSASTWDGAWTWAEDYVYRDGSLAAAVRPDSQGGTRHFHLDHLGSVRLISNAGQVIYAEHAYYPFGREITSPTQEIVSFGHDTPEPMKFTGHERDFAGSYTGPVLDYMHARYYNPWAGRFLSVDPMVNAVRNTKSPQGWNRYAYARNNPLARIDPNGLTDINIVIQREAELTVTQTDKTTITGTPGAYTVSGGEDTLSGRTMEREDNGNEKLGRIPAGTYSGDTHESPHFKRELIGVLDVPKRSAILMHPGNQPKDSEGCILLGTGKDDKTNRITGSKVAVDEVMNYIKEIQDDDKKNNEETRIIVDVRDPEKDQ
jgi:RHS repeat-associated protein